MANTTAKIKELFSNLLEYYYDMYDKNLFNKGWNILK